MIRIRGILVEVVSRGREITTRKASRSRELEIAKVDFLFRKFKKGREIGGMEKGLV